MESGPSDGSSERADKLRRAVVGATVLAPGGFVAGYLVGRWFGVLLSGCPLRGSCDNAAPVLLAIPTSLIGMGFGCTLASARVRVWWQGVVVWSAGILSMILLVVLVGWLGVDTSSARLVGVGWLLLAVGFELIRVRRRRSPT